MRVLLAALLLTACADVRKAEDPTWFDDGVGYDVEEPVAFTDVPYDFPAVGGVGIADLPMPDGWTATYYGAEDTPPAGCDDWITDPSMPMEIEGIVTVHPRIYYKSNGCVPVNDTEIDSDEKYYGSFFIQDATGGVFVLGDTKVAHFDMGDRVRMKVRAVRNIFDLKGVAAHDVLEITRGPEPIFYETATEFLGADDIGRVKRVEGTVVIAADTFGEFQIESDEGVRFTIGLDVELSRRGVSYPLGTRIQATGPVMFAYETHKILVMKVGQIEEI